MAKRKKIVELSSQNINFILQGTSYKAMRYYPTAMTIDAIVINKHTQQLDMKNIPFAYVPKEVKKMIKPN